MMYSLNNDTRTPLINSGYGRELEARLGKTLKGHGSTKRIADMFL